ncbi:MAG: Asp-tRNA(Asn)/Glu-tRNA(Gln) amidotransferase subunit GatC [Nitrospirales bacterium]|nr:Asp-tRNA(Asn)/Glu-tRNA(Gln) amidotransferase subunit GatC [Nitrospira sp.]MDR4502604.1 Asp-tRNA(Asn)/Glu-tRNA(Gln) amidotransferase subunit GatC [Nitrospirales bacterium]
MKISQDEVDHIAHLARLHIAEGEKEQFSEQLSQIVTFVNQLSEVDTEDIPQTATTSTASNVLREDICHACLPVEEAVANAPQTKEGFFVVPKIISDQETRNR